MREMIEIIELSTADFNGDGYVLTRNIVYEFSGNALVDEFEVDGSTINERIDDFLVEMQELINDGEVTELYVDDEEILDPSAIRECDAFTYESYTDLLTEEEKEDFGFDD